MKGNKPIISRSKKGLAIVIDASGSIGPFYDAFFSTDILTRIEKPDVYGSSPATVVNKLLRNYHKVILLTDGELYGRLSKKVQVVKIAPVVR